MSQKTLLFYHSDYFDFKICVFTLMYRLWTFYVFLYKELHRDPGWRFVDSKSALIAPVVCTTDCLRRWPWYISYLVWFCGIYYEDFRVESNLVPCYYGVFPVLFSIVITSLGEEVCSICFSCICMFIFLSFFSSSWCGWLAADWDCGAPWTFHLAFWLHWNHLTFWLHWNHFNLKWYVFICPII